jgi:hypothetical protein
MRPDVSRIGTWRLSLARGAGRVWPDTGTENPGVGSSILPLSTISLARQRPTSRAGPGDSSLQYSAYVAIAYVWFGRVSREAAGNSQLDQLMPQYEVRERHSVAVSAPAETTLAAARDVSFQDSRIARAIFALRALPERLRGIPPAPTERRPVFDEVTALGWRELVQTPGRQVIMGAVTQPWRQEVHFRGLPADEFVAFREPGYAKIAWTLEVEAAGARRRASPPRRAS